MNCEFYGKEIDIDFLHGKSGSTCHKVECDRFWHYYKNGKMHNDVAFVTKCPVWNSQLKKNSADAIFPLSDYAKKQTFESFDITYNDHGKQSIQCQKFINGDEKILLIAGPSHIGKTHLANAILNLARATGYPGTFITVKGLENVFMGVQTYQTHGESRGDLNQLKSTPFLIIDELNEIKQIYVNEFQDLLDGRTQKNNKTVITTNLEPESIEKIYGEKILNRLEVRSKIISLTGKRYKK